MVFLLDYNNIIYFPHRKTKKPKLLAAKNFFEAFTLRTEAYQFKHAVNAIAFDNKEDISVLLEFTELMSHVRVTYGIDLLLYVVYYVINICRLYLMIFVTMAELHYMMH